MDWKTIGNIAAFIGVLVGMFMMFNQINGRLDRMQAETNARFDRLQIETRGRFDALQADTNTRFDTMFDRMDRMQSAISTLDGRVSRIEGWIEGRFDRQSAEATEEGEQP